MQCQDKIRSHRFSFTLIPCSVPASRHPRHPTPPMYSSGEAVPALITSNQPRLWPQAGPRDPRERRPAFAAQAPPPEYRPAAGGVPGTDKRGGRRGGRGAPRKYRELSSPGAAAAQRRSAQVPHELDSGAVSLPSGLSFRHHRERERRDPGELREVGRFRRQRRGQAGEGR